MSDGTRRDAARAPAARRWLVGCAWAALSVTILAGWLVVTRQSVTHELRIWDITALRVGVGALVLLPVLITQRAQLSARLWLEGLLLAVLWGAPFVLLIGTGLRLTSTAHASSITPGLMPVFTGAIAWACFGERPGSARLLGYLAIAIGLLALVLIQPLPPGWTGIGGLAALIGASLLWAPYTMRMRSGRLSATQAAALACFWSTVFFLPPYWWLGLSRLGQASPGELALQAVYQGALMSGVAILAYNRAITLLGAVAAATVVALVPVVATTAAIPILGEVPSALGALAIAAIAAGVLLAARPSAASVPVTAKARADPP